jgi:hypothetical protein
MPEWDQVVVDFDVQLIVEEWQALRDVFQNM